MKTFNVYQVHGSEDGCIAICSSKKRAIAAAMEYVIASGCDAANIEVDNSSERMTDIMGESISAYVETWNVT